MFKFKKKSSNKEAFLNATNNKTKNIDNINGLSKWKKNLKQWCVGLVCVSLLLFASFANTKRIDNENAMTDFSSKVVNIGGYSIALQGNYSVSVWRSGNTVYCKASVYVTAPNGATQAMGASLNTNKANTSKEFVGYGGSTPKSGSGDLQISFSDSGSGTISGTIYAGFTGSLNGSQALTATFSVSYPPYDVDSTVPSNNANGKITYVSHCQNVGWQSWVSDGATSGTTGKGLRMETIAIDSKLVGLSYQAHVAEKGWMSSKTNGQAAGTVGEALAIQAIKISLTGGNAPYYTLKYRAHVANKGWMSWVNAGEIAGTTGQNLDMQAIEITLTPKSYTVTYNGNGGLYNGSSTWSNTATYNENYTTYSNDNFFVRTGYKFNGWNERADGSGTDWTGWINKPWKWSYGHGVTLYAQWKPITYTVTYNGNGATGGSMSNSEHTYDNAKNLTTNGYVKDGYAFLGWSTSPNGNVQYGNKANVSNLTTTNGATVTLYAQWKSLGYEINYDGNGADGGSTSTQYAPFNQTTTLNKNGYYKKGYKFKEWNTKTNGSGESYKDQQNISVDGNKTVTKQ